VSFSLSESVLPKILGWQPNDRFIPLTLELSHLSLSHPCRGKPGPNILDASSVMNTRRIMEQAVDLNVRLMKWRLWPNLNTELLSTTRCLLLGQSSLITPSALTSIQVLEHWAVLWREL
jgi:hypothetical protein